MARLRNLKPDATPVVQDDLDTGTATNEQIATAVNVVLGLLDDLGLRETS